MKSESGIGSGGKSVTLAAGGGGGGLFRSFVWKRSTAVEGGTSILPNDHVTDVSVQLLVSSQSAGDWEDPLWYHGRNGKQEAGSRPDQTPIRAPQLEGAAKQEAQDTGNGPQHCPASLLYLSVLLGGLSERLTSEQSSAHAVAPPGSSTSCLVFFTAFALLGSRGTHVGRVHLDESPVHRRALYGHLWVQCLAQRYLGIFPYYRKTFHA